MVARWIPALVAAVTLVSVAGCSQTPSGVSPAPALSPNPSPVFAATSAPAAAEEPHKGLPDPTITPGERTARLNKRAKLDPAAVKKTLEAYGATPGDARTVVVRLIPPEIGGTDNAPNLFLTTPWFADLKTRLDKKLVNLVKSKQITVEQAEADLTSNWVRASHKYYVRNYGEGDSSAARKIEDSNRW